MVDLTPRQIVKELDRYIVSQDDAKRSVAIALRNRYRRQLLDSEMQEDILPKNILMIGATGVGKTEIARRLARLVKAPFVKVEATKFTEVGYVGRDVESMIRELVETAIRMVQSEKMETVQEEATRMAEDRILDILAPLPKRQGKNPLEALFMGGAGEDESGGTEDQYEDQLEKTRELRAKVRRSLRDGELEDETVEIEVEDRVPPMVEVFSGSGVEEMGINLQDLLGGMFPKKRKKRKVSVAQAREILTQEEAQKLIDMDQAVKEGVERAEQSGMVFLDELDKIVGRGGPAGPDVSREGVQRDILPIVEGSTVVTKYGPVKTDHILFIAAGAFHNAKPSDLIPELQGRFPIRVELEKLTQADFERILVEPRNSLVNQYQALLKTEGVQLDFTPDGVREIAALAWRANESTEDIGARRLQTVMEKLLEDVSYKAPEEGQGEIVIEREYVRQRLQGIVEDADLSKYIL